MRLLACAAIALLSLSGLACGDEPTTPPVTTETLAVCAASYADCGAGTAYQDLTDAGTVTISFGGTLGNSYSPKCVKVKAGTAVKFTGAFGPHPLQQGCGPATSPVIESTASGSEKTVTLSTAGDHGYFCVAHGSKAGAGMAGAIQVVP